MDEISYLSNFALELRVCGKKTIDVAALKAITTYPGADEDEPEIQRFWRVFEQFSDAERALYLKFVWGRTRLPIDTKGCCHKVKLLPSMGPNSFPQAHTCFFTLDLPPYRTDEMCRQRILFAAEACGGIDTDNDNFAE